jgi:hypothetical protein
MGVKQVLHHSSDEHSTIIPLVCFSNSTALRKIPPVLNFDINLRWGDLTHKDRKTCNYVQKRIHKLPFQISELEAIVENFYIETRKNPDSTFAYKGRHYEKDLLAKLNIPP